MTSKDLQQLKFGRLSEPEKIILESFKGLKEETHPNYSDWIYYKSDKGVFYAYNEKNGWLNYSIDLIWSEIIQFFDYNREKTNDVVEELVVKKFNLIINTTLESKMPTFDCYKKKPIKF